MAARVWRPTEHPPLLSRFASKSYKGRSEVYWQLHDRIRQHLDAREATDSRASGARIELLRSRGFTVAAARRWLQHHARDDLSSAWPRR
jgi:hypothetical protein